MKSKRNQSTNLSEIPVVILAGGKGTRLQEKTKRIPKPLLKIKKKKLVEIIIQHYRNFGIKKIYIAAGYRYKIISKYFKTDKNIKVINTGLNTLTGKRIKFLEKEIKSSNFFLTYGDGICNVNILKLYKYHLNHNKIATLTAVRPPSRFGVLNIKNNQLKSFKEKAQLDTGWINGGFFVFNKKFFKFLGNKDVMLEREPLIKLCQRKQINVFLHKGFWRCVDTPRDLQLLKDIKLEKIKWSKKISF